MAVLAAMVPELAPVVRGLRLRRRPLGSDAAYEGAVAGRTVVAAVTSMGTAAAADVTARLLDRHEVDHVVMVGVCGGVAEVLVIGQLLVPDVVVDEATGVEVHPAPLGGHTPAGRLLTTDVLHNQPGDLDRLRAEGVTAVDMETAAVGAVAEARGVPWSVFRAVSDRAGDPAVDQGVLSMSNADGSPNAAGVARYVLTHPHRIPTLARLGRGLRAAVRASTDPLLAELSRP